MKVAFKQVDVFTATPFRGNPLAVILDAQGLADEQLALIARWTNLSETTFVLPPDNSRADYRVRIFTTEGELPFAGHPTLGTAHALLEAGWPLKTPGKLVQECGVGLVDVKIADDGSLAFAAPAATLTPFNHPDIERAINSTAFDPAGSPVIADMGIRWLLMPLSSAEAVRSVVASVTSLQQLHQRAEVNGTLLFGALPAEAPEQYEVRALLVENGSLTEDPVTGSANACLARYLAARGMRDDYHARQGSVIGRAGRIAVTYRDDLIWIGGETVTVIDGTIQL